MPYFQINKPTILDVSGQHAARYLNARLTNDIAKLGINENCIAAALTPQGKTEALFSVIKLDIQHFIIICDAGEKEEEKEKITSAFKRYIVADRVEVRDQSSDWKMFHIFNEESFKSDQENSIFYQRKRTQDLGFDLLSKDSKNIFAGIEEVSAQESELLRIKAGIPSFPRELNEDRLFMESGKLDWVSFTKGCYVGQEINERINSRGKSPKLLKVAVFNGELRAAINDKVLTVDNTNVGDLLSFEYSSKENKTYAFISLKNDLAILTSNVSISDSVGNLI
ncbi:MAG: hypothetical protein SGJ02_10620 [bacterium]|nr:hypothetical protein [bacterium]